MKTRSLHILKFSEVLLQLERLIRLGEYMKQATVKHA